MKNIREQFNRKNISNILLLLAVLLVLFSPRVKALMITGIIKLGLMRAPTESLKPAVAPHLPLLGGLTFRSADGLSVNTAQLRGKVIIVNFWATWCPPCMAEMPSINELYLHYQDRSGVIIIPVDVDGDLKKSLAFMRDHHYALPVYEAVSTIPSQLMSGTIPTTIIIGKNGGVVAKHEGAADYSTAKFYGYIDQLLNR